MSNKLLRSFLTLVILLFSVEGGAAQTYTQMQWGMNKGVTPYAFGANINGTWSNLGTVSSAGVWTIPNTNIGGLGTASTYNIGTSGATVPLLNGANTFSNENTFTNTVTIQGSSYGPLTTNPYTAAAYPSWVYGLGGLGYYDAGYMATNAIFVPDGTIAVTNQYPSGDLNTGNAGIFGTGAKRGGCVSGYTAPNQVSFYVENGAVALCYNADSQPVALNVAGTFTPTTFTPTTPFAQLNGTVLRKGMWVRSADTPPFNGQITSWAVNGSDQVTSITVSNWYQLNAGIGNLAGTPASNRLYINPQDKIWASIGHVFINAFSVICDITSGSDTLTNCNNTTNLYANGQFLTNANFPAQTYIKSYTATTITVSKNATASAVGATVKVSAGSGMNKASISEDDMFSAAEPFLPVYVEGTATSAAGSYTATVVSTPGSLRPGLYFFHPGFLPGTVIEAVDVATSTVTLNSKATSSVIGGVYRSENAFDEGGLNRDCLGVTNMTNTCFSSRGNVAYGFKSFGNLETAFLVKPNGFAPQPKHGFRYDTSYNLPPLLTAFSIGNSTTDFWKVDGGGNMTAAQITATNNILVTGAVGTFRSTSYQSGGSTRFLSGINNSAESGSNAGSNFVVCRYNDAGGLIDCPMTINRQFGSMQTQAIEASTTIRADQAHLTSAALPTISSCGTTPPAAATGSSNNAGRFTMGTGTPTACTVTFANAYSNNAYCTVTPASNYTGTYYISAQNNTAFTVTLGTGTDSVSFNYTCFGN